MLRALSELSEINEKKASGLDQIPCKLLKIAADIVGPSLTEIFTSSIETAVFPSDVKSRCARAGQIEVRTGRPM